MDTPELPPSDQSPSPESQPPESASPETNQPETPNFLTAQAPPPNPNAPLAADDPLRYWHSTQQLPSQPMSTSRPFSEIWKVLWTQPDVMAYRDVLREDNTSLQRSVTWVFSAWGVQAVISIVFALLFGVNNLNNMRAEGFSGNTDTQFDGGSLLCLAVVCIPVAMLIAIALYLLLSVGIPHVAAVAMGGTGTYEQTAFLYSGIYAPTLLLGALSNFVPRILLLQCLIFLVFIVIVVYNIVMQVIAIKAVHDIGWFESVVAVFSPLILLIGFFCCCALLSGGSNSGT
ncbi:MAG: YIP1 family protein [Anaerolineae bacterium]|nr:YIP1 family protein [Anaerolineae bacterium]